MIQVDAPPVFGVTSRMVPAAAHFASVSADMIAACGRG